MRSTEEKMTRAYLRRRREERRKWYREQLLIDIGCAVVGIISLMVLVYIELPGIQAAMMP